MKTLLACRRLCHAYGGGRRGGGAESQFVHTQGDDVFTYILGREIEPIRILYVRTKWMATFRIVISSSLQKTVDVECCLGLRRRPAGCSINH